MSPSYWSASKKAAVIIEAMSLPHARNALSKLGRGEYVGPDGGPPSTQDALEIREALEQRILDLEAERAANVPTPHPNQEQTR